ncbi:MAG: CooT family nickel-binding protein [Deltaproteobacteria bacterium]|nr:CooT family nickel-binding protein [Deltaproteobacteria bacterium]
MCESNVYLRKDNDEKLIMENVAAVTPVNADTFLLKGLLGESMEVKAIIEDINLIGHKIILKALK